MVKVRLSELDKKTVVKIWDRAFLLDDFLYVPDVVADRYSIRGTKVSAKEVARMLRKNWDKLPLLFRRYALADCRELALALVF